MIRKLKRRLILVSMLSLFAVLSLIIGIGIGMSYKNLVDEADNTLLILADNGGSFPGDAFDPDVRPGGDRPGVPEAMMTPASPDGEPPSDASGQGSAEARPGSAQARDESPADFMRLPDARRLNGPSPEFPFETRYFDVTLDGEGAVVSVNLDRIYAVDTEGAAEYAVKALHSGRTSGFTDQYRYLVDDTGDTTTIYFLDCWRNLSILRRFFLISSLAAFAGMAAVLLLIAFFSERIVRPIAESYDKQRRFITDAGHDIKTPLAIINADAEVLEMDIGEDNEWIKDIKAQTVRLTDLTDDLVTLSRMEETGSRAEMEKLDLSELVGETVQPFKNIALSQKETFNELTGDGIMLIGDKKMLGRLVSILLDNAVKYCTPGGAITVRLEERGKQVLLKVTNTADNVSEEDLPHLFERFYRADKSRNSETGGYGIGLSIASSIVSAHKGKIAASTVDDRSLTITVILPKEQ